MRKAQSIALANSMIYISHLITDEFFNVTIKKSTLNFSYKYFSSEHNGLSCYL